VRKMDCKFSGLTSLRYPLKYLPLPAKFYEKPQQGTKFTVPPLANYSPFSPGPPIDYARELVDHLSVP
jgi:hypothetical protein